MKSNINQIMNAYTSGEKSLEETNRALAAADVRLRLDPRRNVLPEEEKRATVVGFYPEQANGWGLLDSGTGFMDKTRVKDGKLLDCDCGDMPAILFIAGKRYRIRGCKLAEEVR